MQIIDNDIELEQTKLNVRCEKGELARRLAEKSTLQTLIKDNGKIAVLKKFVDIQSLAFISIFFVTMILIPIFIQNFAIEIFLFATFIITLGIWYTSTRFKQVKLEFAHAQIQNEDEYYVIELKQELLQYIHETNHKSLDWPSNFKKLETEHPYGSVYDILEETKKFIQGEHAKFLIQRINWVLVRMDDEQEKNRLVKAFVNLRIVLTKSMKEWGEFSRTFYTEIEIHEQTMLVRKEKKLNIASQQLAKKLGDALKIEHIDTYKKKKE